jgi:hypothetical protein
MRWQNWSPPVRNLPGLSSKRVFLGKKSLLNLLAVDFIKYSGLAAFLF